MLPFTVFKFIDWPVFSKKNIYKKFYFKIFDYSKCCKKACKGAFQMNCKNRQK